MQYLLMCCFDEMRWDSIPEREREAIMREYGDFIQDIARSGHHRGTLKLKPSTAATTVRRKEGRPVIQDGPFAETKEQLGGTHLVECRDLDEAMAIALRIPPLKVGGTVEVRPVEFEM